MSTARISLATTAKPALADALVAQSLLYREFKAEQDEILKHKWFESEKKGHDIGYDLAQVDWRIKHSSRWRRERQKGHDFLDFEI